MEAFTFDGDSGDEAKFDAAFGAECFSLDDSGGGATGFELDASSSSEDGHLPDEVFVLDGESSSDGLELTGCEHSSSSTGHARPDDAQAGVQGKRGFALEDDAALAHLDLDCDKETGWTVGFNCGSWLDKMTGPADQAMILITNVVRNFFRLPMSTLLIIARQLGPAIGKTVRSTLGLTFAVTGTD